ncbi:MAG: LysE family translocator [Thaumarchaeota archaeon]|nr:LysE family translocator [Nitrososphaerota archaeon]
MLESWQVFLSGVGLGISIAAPPGPVNAAAAYQVTKSWFAGWSTLLGATTADAIFFLLTYFGLTALIASGEVRDLLFVLGGCFMLYLAYTTLRDAGGEPRQEKKAGTPYVLGLTIGLSNPFQLAWWIAVGIGMISTFGLSIIFGFFTGIMVWTLLYSTLLRTGINRYREVYPYLVYASGAILVAFGVWFLFTAVSSLL